MRDTIIWRGMVVFLSSSALACTPAGNVEQDSASGAEARAAENHADTAAVAAPQATPQATPGETPDAGTAAAKSPATTPAPPTPAASRAADTVKERRGYDRAITPDFKDPRKRLPPAPDSATDSTST
ncbi:MAG TPA: hypothetical protein VFT96_01335 [Gemmatimonadaceae bacterium]|nr:hypothetical protein [Gemmatimonadaceae bacterium]